MPLRTSIALIRGCSGNMWTTYICKYKNNSKHYEVVFFDVMRAYYKLYKSKNSLHTLQIYNSIVEWHTEDFQKHWWWGVQGGKCNSIRSSEWETRTNTWICVMLPSVHFSWLVQHSTASFTYHMAKVKIKTSNDHLICTIQNSWLHFRGIIKWKKKTIGWKLVKQKLG